MFKSSQVAAVVWWLHRWREDQRVLFPVQSSLTLSFWTVSQQNFVFGQKKIISLYFPWLPGVLSVTRAASNRDQMICPSQFSPYVLWEITSLVAPWLTGDVWFGLKYSSCTVCKVPVGKLVCRLMEFQIQRNSWKQHQPTNSTYDLCGNSAHEPKFARIRFHVRFWVTCSFNLHAICFHIGSEYLQLHWEPWNGWKPPTDVSISFKFTFCHLFPAPFDFYFFKQPATRNKKKNLFPPPRIFQKSFNFGR